MKIYLTIIALLFSIGQIQAQEVKTYTNLDSALKDTSNRIKLDLSGQNLKEIPKEIYRLEKLIEINLDSNQITTIPSEISQLKQLESISIEGNNLKSVSKNIFQLPKLEDVSITSGTIGELPVVQSAFHLKNIGDDKMFTELSSRIEGDMLMSLETVSEKIYTYATHAIGFVDPNKPLKISSAQEITADENLKNKRLKISLDLLYVREYPGGKNSIHEVFFNFKAKNQLSEGIEQLLEYNQTRNIGQGQSSGQASTPIFIGLNAGKEGILVSCKTVNVENESDKKFMQILRSSEAQKGLTLLNAVNPIIPILTGLGQGIATYICDKNIKVQDFDLGLNFSNIPSQAKLKAGTYIAIQVKSLEAWNWNKWSYDPARGTIISKTDSSQTAPFNYVIFSIKEVN